LTEHRLLPTDRDLLKLLFAIDPWQLRRKAIDEELTPYEFGRVLLHVGQRRGALGLKLSDPVEIEESTVDPMRKKGKKEQTIETKQGDSDEKVKGAVEHTKRQMEHRAARTFGEMIAMIAVERRNPIFDRDGRPKLNADGEPVLYSAPVRNRLDSFEFHADRRLIRNEFETLWLTQTSFPSELASLLTEELRLALDNPQGDNKWRHQGAIFGQRRTYWDTGTLGRCDLEPTDRCVAIADRHASYYRVLETVNNIRIQGPSDRSLRSLTQDEHAAVVAKLRSQKSGSIPAIRQALKIDKRSLKKHDIPEDAHKLNIAGGDDRELNGDWFHSSIVLGAVGEETWKSWDESRKEGLNRAVLSSDPQDDDDAQRMQMVGKRFGLNDETSAQLVAAWRSRPKLEKRLKMSRRAVLNLLPYMEKPRADGHWLTQIEARIAFAHELETSNVAGTPEIRHRVRRYRLGCSRLTKKDRHFLDKHGLLPPAPTLSNPVVRKAIHEVRRHVIAHIRAHGGEFPDRIVIEFAREATKPKKLSDRIYFRSLNRNKIRKKIVEEVVKPAVGQQRFHQLSHNQLRAAVDRVVLCMQQRGVCAYSTKSLNPDGDNGPCAYLGKSITLRMAALGDGLEVDHVIPYSRCGDNSLNNRVLCFRDSNRNKGRQTPREWWGELFDERSAPMRFMADHQPAKDDYFEKRDYQAKWRNLSRADVPSEWKGSQLSDTAYAAREVQNYLQESLWPDEPTHLEGGNRRILVTKGIYTSILRKDWQLYQKLVRGHESSTEDMLHAALKNRGDHREHAIDAVAIALTDGERIQDLARHAKLVEEERAEAAAQGREPRRILRKPLDAPGGDVRSFRGHVLSQLFDEFDPVDAKDHDRPNAPRIVVAHRPVGRKLTGAFHEETLFGPVPGDETLYTGTKKTAEFSPNHLRLPRPETSSEAINRLSLRFHSHGLEADISKARKRAKSIVESPGFVPRLVDPPPGKSGIVRDLALRRILRDEISRRLSELSAPPVDRDADSFTKGDMSRILKSGPLRMPSGVPIKRVVLLRTMNDPVIIQRRMFDHATNRWSDGPSARSDRAYLGGNNQHIEIRENAKGQWSGEVIPTYTAARRLRIENRNSVDRGDDPARGGRFVMSLAEGETVYMRHKDTNELGYFVVFKLDKPQTIQFKHHWDARRAKGEKNEDGELLRDSKREEIAVTASQLKELAPHGEQTPIKVSVDPLGRVRRLEPLPTRNDDLGAIDPRVVAIARHAVALRSQRVTTTATASRAVAPGSWKWMHSRLAAEGLEHFRAQLSAAMRVLQGGQV
jgi:CRISPR-associated endonuclease Csn1